ncbi:MAG: hypothetical protein KZQ70_11790 [gamma proteobacterium symbiont of Lucinoma myriamae]|nr:hypothetical protein [gamma proteobacterium symbiont of Lucinoma myriamae]MCU7819541.1 hypothetical protein [gamma proteobacterium symbiont of Lucinoma myriamae]
MGIIQIVNEHKDYAGGLESFASCANQCADADMLLQRFFDILSETLKQGKYLITRFDEFNPSSHLIVSRGFDSSQSQQIAQYLNSWNKQQKNHPQKLDAFPKIFSQVLGLPTDCFITAGRQDSQIILFAACQSISAIKFNLESMLAIG